MIYIHRSLAHVPEILMSRRANMEREKIAKLLGGSKDHLDQTRIRFEPRVWQAAKPALFALFHGKCAYCESNIISKDAGDVEHFRPKAGVEHGDGTRSHYYYAWLAYEWDNLLISCRTCS